MDTKLLIDAIVRQTTVLIAQLSTAAGIRAPLAHVADQVFVELALEIERQGVGRKVVAGMFGMALRTYQKRMQRLSESASVRGRTLWEAIYEDLGARDSVRRSQLDERFRHDSPDDVGAVLNDLQASGLVYATGRGQSAVFRALTQSEQRDAAAAESLDALADLAWLAIYRVRRTSLAELQAQLPASAERIARAVDRLVVEGIVHRSADAADGKVELTAENFVLPIDGGRGWEAAVFDHFSTVAASIAAKIQRGSAARKADLIGGATFGFDIYPGHPFEEKVLGLLSRTRSQVDALWEEVSGYNRAHPVPDERKTKVAFYFGQNVQDGHPACSAAGANADDGE